MLLMALKFTLTIIFDFFLKLDRKKERKKGRKTEKRMKAKQVNVLLRKCVP